MFTTNIVLFKNTFFFSPLCGNQYTDKKSLQKHQRIHHPEAWAQRPKGRPKRWKPVRNISFLNLLYLCKYNCLLYDISASTEVKYTVFLSKDFEQYGFAVAYVLPNVDWIASRDLSIFSIQAARGKYRSVEGEYLANQSFIDF